MDATIVTQKRCSRCGQKFPATTQYFNRSSKAPDGLRTECIRCRKTFTGADYCPALPPGMKLCIDCGQMYPATSEYFNRTPDNSSGLQPRCVFCRRAKRNQQYTNDEAFAEAQRKRANTWRIEHIDLSRERAREYASKHREEACERARNYKAAHPEHVRERNRAWHLANPDKANAYGRNRHARKLAAEGTHTAEDVIAQLKRQKSKCYWCGCKLGDRYHVDHVIPLIRGGRNDPSNLVIACAPCNLSKGVKLPHEWSGSGRLI